MITNHFHGVICLSGPGALLSLQLCTLYRQLEAATVFEMSRPLAEPTLRPTMSAKDEMTPARSRAPREVSASAASSRPEWEEYIQPQHSTHEHDGRRTPAEQRLTAALLGCRSIASAGAPRSQRLPTLRPVPSRRRCLLWSVCLSVCLAGCLSSVCLSVGRDGLPPSSMQVQPR